MSKKNTRPESSYVRPKKITEIIDHIKQKRKCEQEITVIDGLEHHQNENTEQWVRTEDFENQKIILSILTMDELLGLPLSLVLFIDDNDLKADIKLRLSFINSTKPKYLMITIYSPFQGSLNKVPLKRLSYSNSVYALSQNSDDLLNYFLVKKPVTVEIWEESGIGFNSLKRFNKIAKYTIDSISNELLIPLGFSLEVSNETTEKIYYHLLNRVSDEKLWGLKVEQSSVLFTFRPKKISIELKVDHVKVLEEKNTQNELDNMMQMWNVKFSNFERIDSHKFVLKSDNINSLLIDIFRLSIEFEMKI